MLRNFATLRGGRRRMILYPAIDIMNGQAVRLVEGRFEDSTTYHDTPLEAARSWVEAGARFLHVVDLDGARSGEPKSLEHLRAIVQETGIPIQYGGGLRTVEAVRDALRAGAERAIVGTAAFRDIDFLDDIVAAYGPRVVVAVDVKDGMIATEGWTQTTSLPAVEAIKRLTGRGVRSFVYTDVSRDGMLSGVDLETVKEIARRGPRPLHLLGRDRHARRPARARAAAPGQPRGRDRGQVALREEVHGRGGSSRARRRVGSNDAEGAVLRGHDGRALSCHGSRRHLRGGDDRRRRARRPRRATSARSRPATTTARAR